jgi:hypothetical protein
MIDELNGKGASLTPTQIGHEIRKIYASTGFYGVFEILFTNSFMLLYFSALHISSERILFYLSLNQLYLRRFCFTELVTGFTLTHGFPLSRQ